MKKSILSVVSIILTFLISCSMTLPAFAKESSLTTTAENDVEDDFDENEFVGKDAIVDPSYDSIPITTALLPNITQPLQYSDEMLAAYEDLCKYMITINTSWEISIEDFYESFCLGQYTSVDEYLSSCKEEISDILQSITASPRLSTSTLSNVENSYWYYNTGLKSPQKPNYSKYNLLNTIQKGDIVYESGNHTVNHISIVEGIYYDWSYGQYYIRLIEAIGYSSGNGQGEGVCRSILDDDRLDEREGTVLRLNSTYYDEDKVDSAIAFCVSQIGKDYSMAPSHSYSASETNWYCSQLIWAAFLNQGIRLAEVDDLYVLPNEILLSPKLEIIISHTTIEETKAPEIEFISVPSTTSVYLSWSSIPGASAYNIYRSRSAAGTYTLIHTITSNNNNVLATSFIDESVSSGSSYCYRVSAVVSERESNRSIVKAARTSFATPIIMLMYSTEINVNLEWSAVYGATNHYVCRSTSETGSYLTFAATNTLEFTDADIIPGTTYYYKIKISDGSTTKESSVSNTLPLVVNTPTIYFGTSSSSSSVTIKWTFSLAATHYIVYRSTSASSGYSAIGTSTETVFTDQGRTAGTTYYYKVVATNGTDESEFSAQRSVTTLSS